MIVLYLVVFNFLNVIDFIMGFFENVIENLFIVVIVIIFFFKYIFLVYYYFFWYLVFFCKVIIFC